MEATEENETLYDVNKWSSSEWEVFGQIVRDCTRQKREGETMQTIPYHNPVDDSSKM